MKSEIIYFDSYNNSIIGSFKGVISFVIIFLLLIIFSISKPNILEMNWKISIISLILAILISVIFPKNIKQAIIIGCCLFCSIFIIVSLSTTMLQDNTKDKLISIIYLTIIGILVSVLLYYIQLHCLKFLLATPLVLLIICMLFIFTISFFIIKMVKMNLKDQ